MVFTAIGIASPACTRHEDVSVEYDYREHCLSSCTKSSMKASRSSSLMASQFSPRSAHNRRSCASAYSMRAFRSAAASFAKANNTACLRSGGSCFTNSITCSSVTVNVGMVLTSASALTYDPFYHKDAGETPALPGCIQLSMLPPTIDRLTFLDKRAGRLLKVLGQVEPQRVIVEIGFCRLLRPLPPQRAYASTDGQRWRLQHFLRQLFCSFQVFPRGHQAVDEAQAVEFRGGVGFTSEEHLSSHLAHAELHLRPHSSAGKAALGLGDPELRLLRSDDEVALGSNGAPSTQSVAVDGSDDRLPVRRATPIAFRARPTGHLAQALFPTSMKALLDIGAGTEVPTRAMQDSDPRFVIQVELLRSRQQVRLKLVVDGVEGTGAVKGEVADAALPPVIDGLVCSHWCTSL